MKNFVGILILVFIVVAVLEFYHKRQESGFDSKVLALESKIDSLEVVIQKGRTNLQRNRVLGKSVTAKAIINDVGIYLKSTKDAVAYEKRGRVITAKELYVKAEKYKLELTKLFSKDSVITLDFGDDNKIDHEYMFNKKDWKLRTHYYNSVRTEGKPNEWITKDNIIKDIENIDPEKKYRVTFRVLETMNIHYSGSVSYFTLQLKYLDIIPLK